MAELSERHLNFLREEGFEPTGEFRTPKPDDFFLSGGRRIHSISGRDGYRQDYGGGYRHILRKIDIALAVPETPPPGHRANSVGSYST